MRIYTPLVPARAGTQAEPVEWSTAFGKARIAAWIAAFAGMSGWRE
jgi:hypothetical protein